MSTTSFLAKLGAVAASTAAPAMLFLGAGTAEAFDIYFSKLKPGGMMAINISNKFVNLNPVLAAIAENRGYTAIGRYDVVSDEVNHSSRWVALAHDEETLAALLTRTGWKRLAPDRDLVWTDDRSGLFQLLNVHPGIIK